VIQEHAQYPHSHFIIVSEGEDPEGWRVWCLHHGSLGAYLSRVQAVLIGLRHDHDLDKETS